MRILFLAPQPFFEVRGTPLAVRSLVSELAALGHGVDLLTYPQGAEQAIPGVRHLRSLGLPVGRVRAGPSLAKILLDIPFMLEAFWRMLFGRYAVVHAVEEAAPLAAPWARVLGVPLVFDMDSSIPDQLQYSGFSRGGPLLFAARALEHYALSHAAAVVTVCGSLTDTVRASFPAARVFQIEDPPLPGTRETAPPAQVRALRDSLGLDDGPVVLYSGNLEPYQGVDALVDAARDVPGVSFLFMGGEPAEVEALRERARRQGTGARCIFSGKRPVAELPLFLSASQVLVSPRSRGTNTPFKIYTYLASGKPLVATRIAAHTQVLDDAVAFLVEPSASGLAAGIREVLSNPDEARRRADRGLALLEREYTEEKYREKVRRAYASFAERVGAGTA